MGVVTGLVSLFTTLSALLSFRSNCIRVGDSTFDVKPGLGFLALLVGTVVIGVGPLFHVLLSTPAKRARGVPARPDRAGEYFVLL